MHSQSSFARCRDGGLRALATVEPSRWRASSNHSPSSSRTRPGTCSRASCATRPVGWLRRRADREVARVGKRRWGLLAVPRHVQFCERAVGSPHRDVNDVLSIVRIPGRRPQREGRDARVRRARRGVVHAKVDGRATACASPDHHQGSTASRTARSFAVSGRGNSTSSSYRRGCCLQARERASHLDATPTRRMQQ
jgi:hypothetical protein